MELQLKEIIREEIKKVLPEVVTETPTKSFVESMTKSVIQTIQKALGNTTGKKGGFKNFASKKNTLTFEGYNIKFEVKIKTKAVPFKRAQMSDPEELKKGYDIIRGRNR